MKVFPGFRMLAALALGCAAVTPRADAQFFGLSVSASANPVSTNTSLVYTTVVTNLSSSQFTGVVITNVLSPSVQILSVDTSLYSAVTNGNAIVFTVGSLNSGQVAETTITVQPTVAGALTNTVTVVDTNTFSIAVTSLVIQVTNPAAPSQVDLAVSMTGPVQAVITNDYFAYGVLVTNLGPADATGVFLTNSLPPGVRFISVAPSSETHATNDSNVVFALGTLTNGAFEQLSIRVQATNAGTWSFPATVGSANIVDTNLANNTASTNIVVGNYLSTNLVISSVSTQHLDMLDGLMEQAIVLSNAGPASVDSARVVVSGLSNQLYNAVGTNNGKPFVVLGAPLDTNQSISLLLQYYVPTHKTVSVSLQAFGVPAFNLAPPAAAAASVSNLTILQVLPAGTSLPGSAILSFSSTSNRTYTVVYSDNASFINANAAQPAVQAYANYTVWIDYGPPATVSHPTNTAVRFYNVFLNP